MDPASISSSSSSSSFGSGSGSKFWIVHSLLAGAAVAAAAGAYTFASLGRSAKFRTRVVGIIPARFASTRFEGKPLVQILGKPMIQLLFCREHGKELCWPPHKTMLLWQRTMKRLQNAVEGLELM